MTASPCRITALYRYPVKGLSPEPLETIHLEAKGGVPGDRAYAIENGPSKFDPQAPRFFQKSTFLMLMKNESLAALETRFDQETRKLSIRRGGEQLVDASLESEEGRTAVETFFGDYSAGELRGPPKVLSAPGHSFWDRGEPLISLINLATLEEIGERVGAPVHPLRFRANIYVSGLPAWQEFDLIGSRLTVGGAELKGFDRITRCAAVNVNPLTAERDLTLPRTLLETYGHPCCGIYLRVTGAGRIGVGDALERA